MNKFKEKRRATLRTQMFRAIFYFLPIIAILFLFPHPAHAEGVYSILKSNTGIGGSVQQIWKGLLTVVNSLIIALLIFVAFAEMLRININTYGVKKILPTMIFAIIAANFSYILVRFIVDIANVSMTFISSISNGNGMLKGSANSIFTLGKQIKWDETASWYTQFFPSFMQWVIVTIEAILLLCLAFLFIARNWMIYALAITSPIAIMAIVLPQTKKYFTQWWDYLIKWTFMPLVSFLFLALANKFTDLIQVNDFGFNFNIMPYVFVGFCLYMAITMPFKLGGPVMQSFYKMSGAKFGVAKTTELYGKKLSNFGNDTWRKYLKFGLDAERGRDNPDANFLSKSVAGRWIGRNWIGNALNKEKGREAEIQKDIAGIVEGVQARDLVRDPTMLMRREYRKNRAGEIDEYADGALKKLMEEGQAARAANSKDGTKPLNADWERFVKYRMGSGVIKKDREVVAAVTDSLISDGITSSIEGRYIDKSSKDERALRAADTAIAKRKEQDDYKNADEAGKKRILEPFEKTKQDIKNRTRQKWMDVTGMSKEEVASARNMIEFAVMEKQSSDELKNKAEKDVLTKSSMELVSIHDASEVFDEVGQVRSLEEKLAKLTQTIEGFSLTDDEKVWMHGIADGSISWEDLERSDKTAHDRIKAIAGSEQIATDYAATTAQLENTKSRALELMTKKGLIVADQPVDTKMVKVGVKVDASGKVVLDANGNEIDLFDFRDDTTKLIQKKLKDDYDEFKAALGEKYKKRGVPSYLRDALQVEVDEKGNVINVDINKIDRTTYTRFAGVVEQKTAGRVAGYAELSVDALLNILKHGDKKDGITAEMAQAFMRGDVVLAADGTPDANKMSRLSAATLALQRKLSSTESTETATGMLSNFTPEKLKKIGAAWVDKEVVIAGRLGQPLNQYATKLQGLLASGASTDQIRAAILEVYKGRTSNLRRDLDGDLIKYMPRSRSA